ncbi:glycosyltransferase [Lyngbya sp. PCC 8106]|uniref:glycosyltransferase family 2 protein n=1 Tax=Lyngbya sp. (strain PCC 8106) TaxID=313612 RepID=UPI0000EAB1C3|nr:glycosyltransferase [Lyngbya sp. PCC 8106]EAW35721.1 probable glucosyltransferase [Lyngbya sp. PCC 8106]
MTNLETSKPLVSVLINNYNYGHFLNDAIDSALNQTYSNIEVIVVDDGSTDNSREVIASYGDKIVSIFQENRGQGSAFNSGWKASQGEMICFLDSDDTFYSEKVEECVKLILSQQEISPLTLVSHNLDVVDQCGNFLSRIQTSKLNNKYKDYSNFYQFACKSKYVPFATSTTSGNVIARKLAERIFPIPEFGVQTSADDFVVKTALLLGNVYGIDKSLGQYRIHGQNNWSDGTRKVHGKEFLVLREEFLNMKLKENGMKPVISFLNSMGSAAYYKIYGSPIDYLKLGFKVFVNQPDFRTFQFFQKTAQVTQKNMIKKVFGIKKPSL